MGEVSREMDANWELGKCQRGKKVLGREMPAKGEDGVPAGEGAR